MKNRFSINFRNGIRYFLFIGLHQDDGLITYQTQIARELKKPNTTVNYWITKFKDKGLIDKQLKLTSKGNRAFLFLWKNENKSILRAHNIQVKFRVIRCPENFPDCFSKSIYELITNERYRGIRTQLDGITVMFYSPKKIICVLKDIYADTDEEISSAVQVLIPELRELLEYEFQGIKLGDSELARIQTMHIAVLDSIIAKDYLIKGFTKENKDYAIDNSHGIPEIELTNSGNALKDIMNLLNLEKIVRKSKNNTAEYLLSYLFPINSKVQAQNGLALDC